MGVFGSKEKENYKKKVEIKSKTVDRAIVNSLKNEVVSLKDAVSKKRKRISFLKEKIKNLEEKKDEPPKKRAKLESFPLIAFTGFTNDNSVHNIKMKSYLIELIGKLGGKYEKSFLEDSGTSKIISDEVTHLICPPNCRTMTYFRAILKNKWIMSTDWLVKSESLHSFVSEENFGFRRLETPLKGKKVLFSQSFISQSTKLAKEAQNIVEIGGGRIVTTLPTTNLNEINSPDITLIAGGLPDSDSSMQERERKKLSDLCDWNYVCTFSEFVEMISPMYLDTNLCSRLKINYPNEMNKK